MVRKCCSSFGDEGDGSIGGDGTCDPVSPPVAPCDPSLCDPVVLQEEMDQKPFNDLE